MVSDSIVISDSGADTTILDDNWLVTSSPKTCRFANLVGFDPTLGTTYGLAVVDAIAKTTVHSGQSILIGIRDGIYNSNSKHTLFSESQIRNSGIVIDSVARTHRLTYDGLYGTQSIYYDTDNPNDWIDLVLVNGLMTFKVTKPTTDEINSMPIYWLTEKDKWRSSDLEDENSIFSSFSNKNKQFRVDNSKHSN